MSMFNHPEFDNHEKLVFHADPDSGLKLIVAIHNTHLGPAMGGCRMWNYPSEEEAIRDVLRLSRGMTYKAAITGLNLGGGKSVIIGDPARQKTPQLLRAMGRFMNSLNGEYITAEDVGISEHDIRLISRETPYVTGFTKGGGVSGDPSPYTAYGVLRGIEQAVKFKMGASSLCGVTVAVQGAGKVGSALIRLLVKAGAQVFAADIVAKNLKYVAQLPEVNIVSPDQLLQLDVDVLAPCALGAVLNTQTIARLRAAIVAGSSNNQLECAQNGQQLMDAGILYVPDYVINSGGLIKVYYQYFGVDEVEVIRHIDQMAEETLAEIFSAASGSDRPTSLIAEEMALRRIRATSILQPDAA